MTNLVIFIIYDQIGHVKRGSIRNDKICTAITGIALRKERDSAGDGGGLQMKLRSYQHYEGGDRRPDYEGLVALADYFQVSTDYLLGRTDQR